MNDFAVPPSAVAFFWLLLPGLVWWGFRTVAREGAASQSSGYRLSRHLLSILARGFAWGVALVPVGLGVWFLSDDTARGFVLLWGGAVFVGFTLLAVGILAAGLRVGLDMMETEDGVSRGKQLMGIRVGMIAVGMVYAGAVFRFATLGPGEILVALHVLGAAMVGLGLNRTVAMGSERMTRLARALGKKDS